MTRVPKVSVCVPVYNGEKYLRQLLDSILAQTFHDFELLISDNCSSDQTQEICRAYAERDARIAYARNARNIGANANSDLLVHRARGDYWVLFGHDDKIAPTFLAKCATELDKDRGLVLCHTLTRFIDTDGEPTTLDFEGSQPHEGDDSPYRFRLYAHVAEEDDPVERFKPFAQDIYVGDHHYGLIRRNALVKTRLFLPYYGSDTVLLGELALMGRFKTINEVLFFRRVHNEGTVYLTAEERQEFAAPGRKRLLPARLEVAWACTCAVMRVEGLSLVQKLRCIAPVAARTVYGLRNRITRSLGHFAGKPLVAQKGKRGDRGA